MNAGIVIAELCGCLLAATSGGPKPINPLGELRIMVLWSLTAAGLLISLTVVVLVLRRLHTPPRREREASPSRAIPVSAWVEAGKRVRVAPEPGEYEDGSRDDTVDFDPEDLGPEDLGGGGGGGGGRPRGGGRR